MVISGKSVMRLVSRICLGSNGRNGRTRDTPAMLNMFHDISRLFGNINGALNGNANIGSMERRGIIDAVSRDDLQ
jgi:hypothetical protein